MQLIKDEISTQPKSVVDLSVIIGLKEKVSVILTGIKKLQSKYGKTKKSKKAIKTMESFLRCHLTCPTIMDKYYEVAKLMKEYAEDASNIG